MKIPSNYVRDLTGQVFGRLTVVEYANNNKHGSAMWNCNCSCGTQNFIVSGNSLTQGMTRSCGCLLRESTSKRMKKNLTGKKFGRWTVIKEAGRDKWGCILWDVICICKKTGIVSSHALLRGASTSCGCYHKEIICKQRLPPGRNIFNRIYGSYTCNAKQRNISFELEKGYFEKLIQDSCFYCGHNTPKTYNHDTKGRYNGDYTYICGIDRVNNLIGYVPSNCVSACELCNKAKSNMTPKEFLTWLKRISKNVDEIERKFQERGLLNPMNIS